MLKVIVELRPFGLSGTHIRTLGEVEIVNDGTGSHLKGNYDVRLAASNIAKPAKVRNYNRELGWLDLVCDALIALRQANTTTLASRRPQERSKKGARYSPTAGSKKSAPSVS